jgi:hypothetical protein
LENETTGDYAIYCGAFERCNVNGTEGGSLTSSELLQPITVYSAQQAVGVSETPGNDCSINVDCDNWMFWKDQTCINGYCVDEDTNIQYNADKKSEIKLDNESIKAWITEHSLILLLAGVLIVFIGIGMAYKKR